MPPRAMIGGNLTLKQLEALIWVADLASFRRAADHLNTTQPNISARIAGIEAALGVTLMERDAGSVRLTTKGAEILKSARRVMAETEALIEAADRADMIESQLRLGVTEMVACTWLRPFLRDLNAAYPNVLVELSVDLSVNLTKDLAQNAFDLTLQNGPFETASSGFRKIGAYPFLWVSSPTIAGELKATETLQNMSRHPLLTHARHTQGYAGLIAELKARGIRNARVAPSNSLTSCLHMAMDGLGIAALPEPLVAKELAAGTLQRIKADWTPDPLSFAARYHAETAATFITAAAQIAQQAAQGYDPLR